MRYRLFIPLLLVALFLASSTPGLAQMMIQQNVRQTESETTRVETRQEVNSNRQLSGTPLPVAVRCAAVTARINARVGFYNERRDNHLQHYQNLQDRLQNLVTSLKDRGYDTTQIQAALQELNQLTTTASNDYALFIAKLESVKNLDCGDGSGEFRTTLDAAQVALQTFQTDLKTIREHVQGGVKDSLQALKDQRPTETNQEGDSQ